MKKSKKILKKSLYLNPSATKPLKIINNLIKTKKVPNPSSNNTLYIFLDLLSDFLIVELDSFVCELKSYITKHNGSENDINSLSNMRERLKPIRNVFAHRFNSKVQDKYKNAEDIPLDDILEFFKELEKITNKLQNIHVLDIDAANIGSDTDIDAIVRVVSGIDYK